MTCLLRHNPAHPELEALAKRGFATLWAELRGPRVDQNRLREVELVTTPVGDAFCKRFLGVQPKNALRNRVLHEPRSRTQADREDAVIAALAAAGFGGPEVLLVGGVTVCGWERRSLLLTSPIAGTALDELDRDEVDEDLCLSVAGLLGSTVAAGIFLPDLGLDHVFRLDAGGFALLDFHNARTAPRPSARELGRAVVRFFKSPGAARFVDADFVEAFASRYLGEAGRDEAIDRTRELCAARLLR